MSLTQTTEDDIKQKRINFMAEIRDALIAGDGQPEGEAKTKKIKKGKKKTTEII